MSPKSVGIVARSALFSLAIALTVSTLEAQIPETFTNLKVLPEDISRRELVGLMRDITGALDVRCGHCHVGEDPERLVGMDFASDDKELKNVARAMMRMAEKINTELLPAIGRENPYRVRCITCHHGLQKPGTLREALREAHAEGGADAFVSRYAELRESAYGAGIYDFGEFTLAGMAEDFFRSKDVATALAVLELNLKHFPASGYSYTMLGEIKMQSGDATGATGAFEKAVAIDPENDRAKQRLEMIKAQQAKED